MKQRITKYRSVFLILIVFFILISLKRGEDPVVSVLALGRVDESGNLLAVEYTAEEDSAGVGEVLPFKRSMLDFTGLACRYQKGGDSYEWAAEGTKLEYNRLWVQWISFELGTKEMNIQVRLFEVDELETENATINVVQRNVWEKSRTTIMAKGYLYFTLPVSEKLRKLEVQRFEVLDENTTIYDDAIFELEHKTLASTIPQLFLPSTVIVSNAVSAFASAIVGGVGTFWHGRRVIEKSVYPPRKREGFLVLIAILGMSFLIMLDRIMSLMVEFPLFILVTAGVTAIAIYYIMYNVTIALFRKKPPRIAIQQPILDLERRYFGIYTKALYIYEFTDKEGNRKEGWIPEHQLDDGDEHKRRMRNQHRQIQVKLIKALETKEGKIELVEVPGQWGLIAKDPGRTYKEIRIAFSIEEPVLIQHKRMETITTEDGKTKEVPVLDKKGNFVYDLEEISDLVVIAAPEGFRDFYHALLTLTIVKTLSEKYHSNLERLVKRNVELEQTSGLDKAVEIGAESMKTFLSLLSVTSQQPFQKDLPQFTEAVMKAGIKILSEREAKLIEEEIKKKEKELREKIELGAEDVSKKRTKNKKSD